MSEHPLPVVNQTEVTFRPAACLADAHGHCVTCSDEALPARVLEILEEEGMARVEMQEERLEVDISLLDGVAPGQVILVHGGVAVGSMEEEEQA